MFPTDGSLPKEPKGDVSSQIAGKQTQTHFKHSFKMLQFLSASSPRFYWCVCVVTVEEECVFYHSGNDIDTREINISVFPVTKTGHCHRNVSPLSPHHHIPFSPARDWLLASSARLRSDSRVSMMSWEGRCLSFFLFFPALCPLLFGFLQYDLFTQSAFLQIFLLFLLTSQSRLCFNGLFLLLRGLMIEEECCLPLMWHFEETYGLFDI